MRVYILKRLLQIIPTILMITLVVFAMMHTIPGDPIITLLGDAYSEEDAIQLRQAYGLDKPLPVQYVIWLDRLVRGDWGASILTGRPVLQDVLIRLPVTLELIVLSMAVALAIAIPAAIIGAVRRNTWADYTATTVAMIGVSIPEFFIGVLLLITFSIGLGGAFVVETLFAMPGLGTFGIDAIIARDYQQVQGFALITAIAFVVINVIVDMTYTFLDPRIRY